MIDYVTSILRRKSELEKAMARAEKFLEKAPAGTVRTSTTSGLPQFYHVTAKTTARGKFISKTRQKLISDLIQKEYSQLFLKDASKELKAINNLLERSRDFRAERAISKLHRNKISYAEPYLISDEEYARRWEALPYKVSDYKVKEKVYPTLKGDLVRTKSEAILADMYYTLGIPYKYECPVTLYNGKIKYPDFAVLDVRNRRVIYHEHFGLMDKDDYRKSNLIKVNDYRKSGIYMGKNLIITHEADGSPLNVNDIKKYIEELFL